MTSIRAGRFQTLLFSCIQRFLLKLLHKTWQKQKKRGCFFTVWKSVLFGTNYWSLSHTQILLVDWMQHYKIKAQKRLKCQQFPHFLSKQLHNFKLTNKWESFVTCSLSIWHRLSFSLIYQTVLVEEATSES